MLTGIGGLGEIVAAPNGPGSDRRGLVLKLDGHNVEAVHRSPETRAKWTWLEIARV